MEKYVTNIKDLVIQTLTNGSEIKAKAESGDALSCFQMGMIHLLGIDTPIDFKKAGMYLGNPSLSDDPDANRLLGFIAECEGRYSQAFSYYSKAGKGNRPYVNKVFEERSNFLEYLKEFGFSGTVLNKEITSVLNECISGGLDVKSKLAFICEDEVTCLEVSQAEYDKGDFSSAMYWLLRGKIAKNNSLFIAVETELSNARKQIKESKLIEVVELEGDSLLAVTTTGTPYDDIKTKCEAASVDCINNWHEMTSQKINEEKGRIKKQKDEEAARIKKQQDEEAARIRKQKEEEANRLKMEQAAEQTALIAKQEEQAAQKKKMIRYVIYVIIMIIGFIQGYNGGLKDAEHPDNPDGLMGGFAAILSAILIFLVIEWYINRRNKKKNAL